jgi:GNAT superfamily N-acetyltransferase
MTIRPAAPGDEAVLLSLIRALARFERLDHTVTGSAEALARDLFGDRPACEALLAEDGGVAVGYALYFTTYSTFLTKPGLWLEDLFVLESHRRRGIGLALLTEVRRVAEARGCGRFEWSVLDWNTKAIALYERFGATVMPDWRICRVSFAD